MNFTPLSQNLNFSYSFVYASEASEAACINSEVCKQLRLLRWHKLRSLQAASLASLTDFKIFKIILKGVRHSLK